MPVQIIAHRGWWKTPEEQNTLVAFARAFDAGIGVELDVRDYEGGLVARHDPPTKDDDVCDSFSRVLDLLNAGNGRQINLPLAVNVKSCGLAPWFAKIEPKPANWFFFGMAPQDAREYRIHSLPTMVEFSMNSPLVPISMDGTRGVVIVDRFFDAPAWINNQMIISEEVFNQHGFVANDDSIRFNWKCIRERGIDCSLLTDLVPEAMEFFGGSDK